MMGTKQPPDQDDETKFNETLKRMLATPPKPRKKGVGPKPNASPLKEDVQQARKPVKRRRKAKEA